MCFELQLYWVNLSSEQSIPIEHYYKILTLKEKNRAERFSFEKDRNDWVKSRAMLRAVLVRNSGFSNDQIEFVSGKNGKPFIKGDPVYFNLSHCQGRALIGISFDSHIGVDAEAIKPIKDLEKITKSFFSDKESKYILKSNNELNAFYEVWTKKEAFLKATGLGIGYPMSNFEVPVGLGESLNVSLKGAEFQGIWSVQEIEFEKEFKSAYCVSGDLSQYKVSKIILDDHSEFLENFIEKN